MDPSEVLLQIHQQLLELHNRMSSIELGLTNRLGATERDLAALKVKVAGLGAVVGSAASIVTTILTKLAEGVMP